MAGKTLSEKIIEKHCGKEVKAGETVIVNVDLSCVQDGTGPLTIMKEMGIEIAYNLAESFAKTKGTELGFPPLPQVMKRILQEGGLVAYIKAHKSMEL